MSSINELKKVVTENIFNTIKHPYLNKHLPTPKFDDVKLLLLLQVLVEGKFEEDQIIHYCKALMIHQIALDTHEKVSSYEGSKLVREKKQLTVLEGDYYSGLYYEALANSGEINLIKELSYAVEEMNEQKINLVHHHFASLTELLECITIIESTIHVHFSKYIGAEHFVKEIEKQCLLSRIKKEQVNLEKNLETDFLIQIQNIIGVKNDKNRLKEEIINIITKLQN